MIGEAVKNQDLIVHLLTLLSQRKQVNGVRFQHVRAHRGEVGNEGADVSYMEDMHCPLLIVTLPPAACGQRKQET
jgi:ribonuclease HI